MPHDFDRIESVAEFLAQEPEGDAVRVTDSAMEPVLFAGDIVRLENRAGADDEVVCLEIGGAYLFGYRDGDVLHRSKGADIHVTADACHIGVVVTVIDRKLIPLIPVAWRTLMSAFVSTLDDVSASFKAGKNLATAPVNDQPKADMEPKLPTE